VCVWYNWILTLNEYLLALFVRERLCIDFLVLANFFTTLRSPLWEWMLCTTTIVVFHKKRQSLTVPLFSCSNYKHFSVKWNWIFFFNYKNYLYLPKGIFKLLENRELLVTCLLVTCLSLWNFLLNLLDWFCK